MKVKIETWKIKDLILIRDKINSQPRYQRGEVWKPRKSALLIDSIMRGVDLPKIYLRKLSSGPYLYEVADGQQRLNAIYSFKDCELTLPSHEDKGLNLSKIESYQIGGLTYDAEELPNEFRKRFDNYLLTIAVVEDASHHEIRVLFGRLQEGESLVPAEKRNAIISKIGVHIDNFAINHIFFKSSYISEERFKRQDYMAHVFALIFYNNSDDLKANLLLKLYLDKTLNITQTLLARVGNILDMIHNIDQASSSKIYKKFHFIDFFWFLYKDNVKNVDYDKIAERFDDFEKARLEAQDDPKKLITGNNSTTYNQNLFDYLQAFKSDGASVDSINKRKKVFSYLFKNYIV